MVNEPDDESSQSRPMGDPLNPSEKKRSGKSKPSPVPDPDTSPPGPDPADARGASDEPGVSSTPSGTTEQTNDPEAFVGGKTSQGVSPNHPEQDASNEKAAGQKVVAEPGPTPEDHESSSSPVEGDAQYEDPHGHHDGDRNHVAHPREGDYDEDDWYDEDEEGGGPVKSFLEHLEDLRWVIIRSVISVLIAMVVCLAAANKVVDLLKEPLEKAQRSAGKTTDYVALVQFGTSSTNLHPIKLKTNQFGAIPFGTNRAIKIRMEPVMIGTNLTMGLQASPAREEEIPYEMLVSLKNMGPISPFVVALKIALFGGIGLASPFVFFFIGQFIVPALRQKEKQYLYRALAIGTGLFCAGVAFCYFAMLQIALNAAMKFSRWMNFEPDIWRAEEYIGFVVKFLLGMGLSFELPVVLLTLVKLELLDYERMKKFRPYWVIVNLVLAAMLTPPDVVSQLLMAIPLQVLYEISVLIAWYWHKQDQKRLREEGLDVD